MQRMAGVQSTLADFLAAKAFGEASEHNPSDS